MNTAQGEPPDMRAKKKPMEQFWMIARVYSVEGSYPEMVGPPIASYAEACETAKVEAKRMAAGGSVCTVVILQSMAMAAAVEAIGIIRFGSYSPISTGPAPPWWDESTGKCRDVFIPSVDVTPIDEQEPGSKAMGKWSATVTLDGIEYVLPYDGDRIFNTTGRVIPGGTSIYLVSGPTEKSKCDPKEKPMDLDKTCVYADDSGVPEVFVAGEWCPLADFPFSIPWEWTEDSGTGQGGDRETGPHSGVRGGRVLEAADICDEAAARDGKTRMTHGSVRRYFQKENPRAGRQQSEPLGGAG